MKYNHLNAFDFQVTLLDADNKEIMLEDKIGLGFGVTRVHQVSSAVVDVDYTVYFSEKMSVSDYCNKLTNAGIRTIVVEAMSFDEVAFTSTLYVDPNSNGHWSIEHDINSSKHLVITVHYTLKGYSLK